MCIYNIWTSHIIVLEEVDFSFNQITEMKDLSAYHALTTLILDSNNISEIKGLQNCSSLTYLSMAYNRIAEISGLTNLFIKTLCLSNNEIVKIRGLESLQALENLDLANNKINSLEGLEGLDLLQTINLKDNQISDLKELRYIDDLPLLRELNLLNNPIQDHPDYWLTVLFMLQRLSELDGMKIKVEEKVTALNKHGPPPEVVAAQDHMSNIMYSMTQPQRVFDSTLPSLDAPYPMLILTGPQSCGKRELTHRLCRQFKDFFRYGACHTTRDPYFGEDKRFDYHFITQEAFDEMTCSGKFIVTMKYSYHHYALSKDTIESIAREGLACCTHMEIEGVRSLKNTYFEPRYILVVPMNKEKYEGSLRRKGLFSRPEIELAVSRVDMYMQINQDLPGFFDAAVNVDDLDDAYVQLSRLIKEFLGLTDQIDSATSRAGSGDRAYPGLQDSSTTMDSSASTTGRFGPITDTNEFLDSAARKYSARVSAKLAIHKSPMEEASMQRRQQAARRALVGKPPSAYAHLFERSTVTAPATLGPDHRLLDRASYTSMLPSGSNVSQERSLLGASPETSSQESGSTSGLSMLSSAGVFSAEGSASFRTPIINIHGPEEEQVEPMILRAEPEPEGDQVGDIASEAPVPLPLTESIIGRPSRTRKSSSPRGTATSRPGSNKKPVLPPIPSGRKIAKT
ncbi:leucine-rich repeat and guanylate kinase domain-containing protein isoform X2 [Microcaecilia unicolor]|uniref:Leucine-rich repeat and guanylate kinase domain-containing protein isoform X2 n=1 Tax=Microcaecilia unicolor TaxID=1415580 RepID=A0A6P7ZC20_9AMPH|nr:leucine-rich repeat and guanylate kinase domain-containing protein isoform X2 [Microcaecilia unicolor]